LSSKYAIRFSIFGVILLKAIPEFPVPFNQQPERKTDDKINKMAIFIRKIISLKVLLTEHGHTPPFKTAIFFSVVA
jgi:hypothetical protein